MHIGLAGIVVSNPAGGWCERVCVLSDGSQCDELITRPEKSYRMWCVVVCDRKTSKMRKPRLALGYSATAGGGGRNVFITLVIHYAMRMRRIILLSVTCPVLPYFPTLSQKWHEFRGEKKSVKTKSVFLFSLLHLSERVLILRRIQRDIITNVHRSSHTVAVILVRF